MFDPLYRPAWYAFLTALLASVMFVPLVRRVALRARVVALPLEERRVHTSATPLLGGVAMLAALLIAVDLWAPWLHVQRLALLNQRQLLVTVGCAAAICLLGALDDIMELSWKPKLLGQVGIAAVVVLLPALLRPPGTTFDQAPLVVNTIDLPILPPWHVPAVIGVTLVVLWIVAVMNMMNFADGVDGLAAGEAAIIGATFATIAASYDRIAIAVLAAATSGAATGFLPHNWRKGGARIFMGDSGSMLLGFLLAVISVQGVLKTTAAISLVIPFALMAVPILDTSFVVLKRLKHGVSVASADRWHLHHRLLNVGLSPRRVAATLWAWTAAMSSVALALRFIDYGNSSHWRTSGLVGLGIVVALAGAVSLVLAVQLEIIKSRRVRERNRRIAERRAAERGELYVAQESRITAALNRSRERRRRFRSRYERRASERAEGRHHPVLRPLRLTLGVVLVVIGILVGPLPGPGFVIFAIPGALLIASEWRRAAHFLDRLEHESISRTRVLWALVRGGPNESWYDDDPEFWGELYDRRSSTQPDETNLPHPDRRAPDSNSLM